MAGQRAYGTNFLTSSKQGICVTTAYTIDTSKTTGGATNVAGKTIQITSANGVCTIQFPEKYGKIEWLDARIVDPTKTGNTAVITGDYNPANGQCQISILSSSQAAVTTGIFKLYIIGVFTLG